MLQERRIERRAGARDAADEAARLVIARGDDERLARMRLGEARRHLDGVVERQLLGHAAAGVVGMAGVVDLAALAHEEETVRTVQQFDALLDDFRERGLGSVPVKGIVHTTFAKHAPDGTPGLERLERRQIVLHERVAIRLPEGVRIDPRHRLTPLFQLDEVAVRVEVTALGLRPAADAAAGKVVEAALDEVHRNRAGIPATAVVRIKTSGGCMDDRHGRHDADLTAGLLRHRGDGLDPRAVGTHPKHAVVRLLAAGDRRRGRGGIRHDLVRALRRRFRAPREMVHREFPATGPFRKVFGHQALRRRHPVTDKHKHILRRRGKSHRRRTDKRTKQDLLHSCNYSTNSLPADTTSQKTLQV